VARRRAAVPPPPRPDSRDDPQADTLTEWRQHEREKAGRRAGWVRWCAAAATLPHVAGGLYAFPLAYLWRLLCGRRPALRAWGLLWAAPVLLAVALQREAVLAPTRALYALPGRMFGLPVAGTAWVDVPLVWAGEVALADPRPLLLPALLEAWPTGLVLAALLAALWGAGGLLEGPRLRARSAGDVVREASRRLKNRPAEIERGLLLRGYITMLFARQGTGKTEYLLWLTKKHPEARFYLLTEQTDDSLAPYLSRWGLAGARNLHIVTREKADELWRRHGHDASPEWTALAPLVLEDAGHRGDDVFVMDTWTAWTNTQEAKGIQKAMAPIREAVGRHRFAFLALGHTNKDGELLGSKEFERLCDVSVGGEVVEGSDARRLWWVKDRSPANLRGQEVRVVRDLDGPGAPCYREVSGGGKGGVPEKTETETSADRVRSVLSRGPAKVAKLRLAAGLSAGQMSAVLNDLEKRGRVTREKDGQADVWRLVGTGEVGEEAGDAAAG
jgi:hypothetical protein